MFDESNAHRLSEYDEAHKLAEDLNHQEKEFSPDAWWYEVRKLKRGGYGIMVHGGRKDARGKRELGWL